MRIGHQWHPMVPMMNALIHDLPNRMRFKVPGLKGNPVRARMVQQEVLSLSGVTAVRANPLTGSLLVEHRGAAATRDAVMARLAAVDRRSRTRFEQVASLLEAIAGDILESMIERALRAALVAAL
jgi:heavy-metal-associated domain-containing protein